MRFEASLLLLAVFLATAQPENPTAGRKKTLDNTRSRHTKYD